MNTLDFTTSLIAFLEPFMSTKETFSFFDVRQVAYREYGASSTSIEVLFELAGELN